MESETKLSDAAGQPAIQSTTPGVELDTLLKGRRRDAEVLLEVGRIEWGGVQSIAHKQAELLRGLAEDVRAVLGKASELDGSRLDAARKAARTAIGNVAEMAEIALQSQTAAFDAIRQRAQESVEELKALAAAQPKA